MKTHGHPAAKRRREGGQIIPLVALWIVVLIPFVGLSIDLGFAYIAKAQLSKAVDAAALAGISNYYQKAPAPQNIAISTFNANFEPTGTLPSRYASVNGPTITFSTAANGNETIQVQASTTLNTFFIRMLPAIGGANWNTLTVGDTGQATRSPVIMTLVLDHSYSMDPNCNLPEGCTYGGTYLPNAVADFISDFEDTVDKAAVVAFGSTVTTLLPMSQPFINQVKQVTAAGTIVWGGGTDSVGGLTNALVIENSVVSTQAYVKAVVFFTDGQANMIEATSACPTGVNQPWNFGGYLPPGQEQVSFWPTNMPDTYAAQETGETCTTPGCCSATADRYQSFDGTWKNFAMSNVVYDATNRCILVANQMRAAGIYVYCIGFNVGGAGNTDVPDPGFLQQVANDPLSPSYNPALPVGAALVAGNGADLDQLFQQIAGDIELRLTQ